MGRYGLPLDILALRIISFMRSSARSSSSSSIHYGLIILHHPYSHMHRRSQSRKLDIKHFLILVLIATDLGRRLADHLRKRVPQSVVLESPHNLRSLDLSRD